MSSQVLWRIVFGRPAAARASPGFFGPWHPNRSHVERWARWFQSLGHETWLQSNRGDEGLIRV